MPKLPDVNALGSAEIRTRTGIPSYRATSGAETLPGESMMRAGDTFRSVSESIDRTNERQNVLRAEEAFTKLRQRQLDMTAGEDGFVHKKGANAVNEPLLGEYDKRFGKATEEIAETLGNDEQRNLFKRRAAVASTQFKQDILNHVTREQTNYASEVFKSGIDIELQNAVARYQDPPGIALSLQRVNGLIKAEADRLGKGREWVQDTSHKLVSVLHNSVTEKMIAEGDLGGAESYLKSHKEDIDPKTQLHLSSLLKSRGNEAASEMRVDVQDKMQDMEAMGKRGVVPPEGFIKDSDIETAYRNNPGRIEQAKRRRDEVYRFAVKSSQLYSKGNDELVVLVNQALPPGTKPENFAEESKHHDDLRVMASNIVRERLTSPMEYAEKQNVGAVNRLDLSSPENFAAELVNRQKTAKIMKDQFGSPLQLLTKSEAGQLSQALKDAPATAKRQYFGKISESLKGDINSYKSVMAQIAPDDPVTAIAGLYVAKGREQAADLMLKGQDILRPLRKEDGTPDKGRLWPMPPENDLRTAFANYEGDAFAGHPQARSDYYQAALAIYAAKSAEKGDASGAIDSDRWDESIKLATGGIDKWKGKYTVLPHGYEAWQFRDSLYRQVDDLAKSGRLHVNPSKLKDLPVEIIGDGKYVFRSGDSILVGKDGKPIILDFTGPPPIDTWQTDYVKALTNPQ